MIIYIPLLNDLPPIKTGGIHELAALMQVEEAAKTPESPPQKSESQKGTRDGSNLDQIIDNILTSNEVVSTHYNTVG